LALPNCIDFQIPNIRIRGSEVANTMPDNTAAFAIGRLP
jgi:hypothetical protein